MRIYEELMKFLKEESGETRRVIKTAKTGPGRPDRYQLLAEEDENAWYVSTTQKTAREKAIIFSDPFLAFRQPSTYEPELWRKLLNQHTVFLWQGKHIPFQELKAITDEKSFWTDVPNMPFVTKEQIMTALQQQGCKTDNFIVIDALQYYHFLAGSLFNLTKFSGYRIGNYSAFSWNDAVVCGIGIRLLPKMFPKVKNDDQPLLPKLLEELLTQISSNIIQKTNFGATASKRVKIYCESQSQLEEKLQKYSTKTDLQINNLMLFSGETATQQVKFVFPRLTAKKISIASKNHHHWDLSEIEGCESVSLRGLDKETQDTVVIFPPLTKTVRIAIQSIRILNNLPASTQELSLILPPEQNIKELVEILAKLPTLKTLNLTIDADIEALDLSSLKLQTLIFQSKSSIKIKGMPLSLSTLILASNHLTLPNLKEHTQLKFVCLVSSNYSEYLPSSVEMLILASINTAKESDIKINLNHLTQLQSLSMIDCNAVVAITGLSPTLRNLYITQCRNLNNLNLSELVKLEHHNLDRDHHLPQKMEDRYLPQIEELTRSLTIKGVVVPDVSPFPVEQIVIKKSMLMCETFYPATIKKLEVTDSIAWKNDLDLSRFTQLDKLSITNIKKLNCVKNLPQSLKVLIIQDCANLESCDFQDIEQLDQLSLSGTSREWRMLNSRQLKRVGHLNFNKCKFNTILDFSGLDECTQFTLIDLDSINIRFPQKCEFIHIENCHNLESLDFSKIEGLRGIKVERCYSLRDIHGFPHDLISLELCYNPFLDLSIDFNVMPLLQNVRFYQNYVNNPREEKRHREQEQFGQFTRDVLSSNPEYRQNDTTAEGKEPVFLKIKTVVVPDSSTKGFSTRVTGNGAGIPDGCAVMVFDKEGIILREYYRFNAFNRVKSNLAERSLIYCYRYNDVARRSLAHFANLHPLQNNTLETLELFCNNNPDWGMCSSELEISQGEEFPLISTPTNGDPQELVIYCNDAADLDLIIDYTEQRICVALKPGVQNKTIKIAHRFKIQPSYILTNMVEIPELLISHQPLLDEDLSKEISAFLASKPEYNIFLDNNIHIKDKLSYLYELCLNFDLEKESINASSHNSLDIIFDIMRNKKGVCRHRAEVFMLIAHYLGFPVTMYNNGEHQFIDMPIIVKDKVVRQGFCLGGGFVLELRSINPFKQIPPAKKVLPKELKTREQQEQEAILKAKQIEAAAQEEAKLRPAATAKSEEEAKARAAAEAKASQEAQARAAAEAKAEEEAKARAAAEAKAEEEAKARAAAETKAEDSAKTPAAAESKANTVIKAVAERERAVKLFPSPPLLDSVASLFSENAPHAPLLQLPANQDPIKVAAKIRYEFLTMPQNRWPQQTLYVHDLSDFKRLSRPVQIADGNRRIISGPLLLFLQKGGVVIINWSRFTDTQKKRYMALLEPEGTLFSGTVSPYLKIISLIQDTAPSESDAFLSRLTPFRLSQSFNSHIPSQPKSQQNAEFVEAELYYLHNWRERLLGMPIKDGQGYHFRKQGKLLAALAQKKNLRLYNIPESESLEVFLQRIRIEHEIFHNANFITLPHDFQIEARERPFAAQNDHITIKTKPDELPKPGHFCNANTLHECFQPQVVDSRKDNTEIARGFLAIGTQFYITETITRYEWQELLDKSKKYPHRQFTFTLLPGGEIQGIAKYSGKHSVKVDLSQVVFSNDTDFCALQLKAKYYPQAIIVDVNPQLTYQELIALLDDQRDLTGQVTFTYKQQTVLSALIHGATIILNGEISYLLYQQLLPYLNPKFARIHQNGDEISIAGRLICVLPQELQDEFPSQTIQVEDYQPEDYLAHITSNQRELAKKVCSLFKIASQLSHLDLGQPPVPQLTFRRLTSMLTRLNNDKLHEIHIENPIKGLMHYDYPIYSVNYAFLNVVAKFYFAPAQSKKAIRWSKCRQFIADHKIQNWQEANHHIWKLLNFCSGQVLRELFTASLMDNMQIINGKPLLKSDEISKKLFHMLTTQHIEEKVSPHEVNQHKPVMQLETLLSSGGTRVIFFKGPSGGGKSFALNALRATLPQGQYFKGRHQYSAYLSAKPVKDDMPVVLNLEEINTAEPGELDIFKGMLRDPSLIHLSGDFYRPTPQHILVGSGNQETYQNRSFHKFLQEYAETIRFKLPNDHWLVTTIIKPILDDALMTQADSEFVANALLSAFHQIQTDAHCEMSLRDLRSLAQRFIIINNQKSDVKRAVSDAIWYEFGYKNQEHAKPAAENAMRVFRVGHLLIPETKYFCVEIINHDLNISAKAAADGQSFRRGILIEGPSGVGKSSLYKVILEQRGYRKDHPDPRYCYYEISIDDSESTLRKILEAAILGCKVIADELDPCVEELLNECLEGQLPDHPKYQAIIHQIGGNDAKVHPDFFVLASRNHGVATSAALLNRFHYIITETYTRAEYQAILVESKIPNPEEVLDQFFAAQQRHPRYYNARKFFEWLNKQINQTPTQTHDVKQWCSTLFTDDNYKKHSFASFKRLLENPEQHAIYRSMLDEAVQQGNLPLLLKLIENQMPLMFTDPISSVFSALNVEKNAPGITETVLAHTQIDYTQLRLPNGNTIVHCCTAKGLYSLLAYLLRHIQRSNSLDFLNIINNDGLTAFALACTKHDLRALYHFQLRSFFEISIVSQYVNSIVDAKSLMWQLITSQLVIDNHFLARLINVLNVDYRNDEGESYLELLCQQTPFFENAISLLVNKHPHLINTLSQTSLNRCFKDPDSPLAKDILFLSTHLPNLVLNESLQECNTIKQAVLKCCKPWNYTKLLNLNVQYKDNGDFLRLLVILSEENTCSQYPRTERQRQSLKALAHFEYQHDDLIARKTEIINELLAYQSTNNVNMSRVDSLLMAIVCAQSLEEVNQCISQQLQIHNGDKIPFAGPAENCPEHLKPMPLWQLKNRYWNLLNKLEQTQPSSNATLENFF